MHGHVLQGREQAAQTLVSSGIDVNLKDRCGWTVRGAAGSRVGH